MTIQKTYMLRHFDKMQKHVMVGSKRVLCEFTYTSTKNQNFKGTFTASNPEVIQKLEESNDFNREYYLYREEEVENTQEQLQYRTNPLAVKKIREEEDKRQLMGEDELAEKSIGNLPENNKKKLEEAAEAIQTEQKPVEEKDDVPEVQDEVIVVSAEEVQNVQQAKEYLKKKFPEITARQIANKANVIDIANEKGVKFESIQV
jgi:hypothetical protein